MPLISVVIPVYNVENYLKQCIDSVLSQSVNNIEIILVNDGSSDNCPEICDEYANIYKNIKVIHKENGGLSDARNYGILKATGKYLLFLDSDDFWIEDSLYKIKECLKEDSEVDLIFLSMIKYFEKRQKFVAVDDKLVKSKVFGNNKLQVLTHIASRPKFAASACTKLVKRQLLIDNSLYFEKSLLSEDIDWTIGVLMKAYSFNVCECEFYAYRQQREGSITENIKFKNVEDLLSIINRWIKVVQTQNVDYSTRNLILSLLAYEYVVLLGIVYYLDKKERNIILNDISPIHWILDYRVDNKTILIKKLINIVGFKFTSLLLNLYIRLKTI